MCVSESIFNAVDRLHDAASSGKLSEVTNLNTEDVIGWLQDIVYTANETIHELEGQQPTDVSGAISGSASDVFEEMIGVHGEPSYRN